MATSSNVRLQMFSAQIEDGDIHHTLSKPKLLTSFYGSANIGRITHSERVHHAVQVRAPVQLGKGIQNQSLRRVTLVRALPLVRVLEAATPWRSCPWNLKPVRRHS